MSRTQPHPETTMLHTVWLSPCPSYQEVKAVLARHLEGLGGCQRLRGCRVLLKPNLVTARRPFDPACTDPRFVRAVAELVSDCGARPMVGDSPAFGTARQVMRRCGMAEALAGLPVDIVEFRPGPTHPTTAGVRITLARAAADCDLIVNLPKVKAHNQFRVTLAMKNFFGTVIGIRKPWLHMRLGEPGLARCIIDIPDLLPPSISLCDGIIAMHRAGPAGGDPLPLGLVASGANPVAVDTALLDCLEIAPEKSPLWRECCRRRLPGSQASELSFPERAPHELDLPPFEVPFALAPVRFSVLGVLRGLARRIART